MSQLRLLICRVDEGDNQVTERARVTLPPVLADAGAAPLDTLEAQVATVGQCLLGRLCELPWDALDAQAVARYRAGQAPGSVVADGSDTLFVASRFGTLQLRRQVCAHHDGRPHIMPGNDLLPMHQGILITRGLQEQGCLLPQDLPFATAACLLGWQSGEPGLLSTTTLRTLVRAHGARIRCLEQGEAQRITTYGTRGQRLRVVPEERPRRHAGWPSALSAAVEAALADGQRRPPGGVSQGDWDRVRTARTEDATATVAALRRLGPEVAPGQMLLVLDEVLAPTPGRGNFHELRTACLLTSEGRRYLSGTGAPFLHQAKAAVQACCARSLLVVADGASWIRTFFRDHLAAFPQAEMLLDWSHLAQKCRDVGARICPDRARRRPFLRRLLRALWAGAVPRAVRVLEAQRPQAADASAVDTVRTYLEARSEWIPAYRTRRRQRRYIGSGLGEKANDRIVVRRQKRRGMQWREQTSDALAALRTLQLNEGWDAYWHDRRFLHLTAA